MLLQITSFSSYGMKPNLKQKAITVELNAVYISRKVVLIKGNRVYRPMIK